MSDATQPPADVRGKILRASILPFEDEDTLLAGLRAGAEAVERGELDAEDFAGIWSQYLRELFRRASSVPAPADVRVRVAKIVREAMADAGRSERLNTFVRNSMWDYTDRILALLPTPRGEGEAWRAFIDALDEFEAAANLWVDPMGPTAADMERLCQSRQRVLECARALATIRPEAQGEEEPVAWLVERRGVEMFGWHPVHVYLGKQNAENVAQVLRDGEWDVSVVPLYRATRRSEAQGEDRWEDLVFGPIVEGYNEAHAAHRSDAQKGDADALDLIRWAESRHAALEPVAGNIMPPGTYACYAGDGDDPYMGPGILGAIRAARRGEGGGA